MLREKVFAVSFDAAMTAPEERKNYREFVRSLKKEGFVMLQRSFYVRHFEGSRSLRAEADRITAFTPETVQVCIFSLPIANYEDMVQLNCDNKESVIEDTIII